MHGVSWRLLPYLTALLVGIDAGAIVHSPTVAALAALAFASIWACFYHRSDGPP